MSHGPNFEKILLRPIIFNIGWVIIAAVFGLSLIIQLVGLQEVADAFGSLSVVDWGMLVKTAAAITVLRAIRFHLLLVAVGARVGWSVVLRIYAAGYALLATPGKLGGAALRIWLFGRAGVPHSLALSAWIAESVLDVMAVLLVGSAGLATLFPKAAAASGGAAMAAAAASLLAPAPVRRICFAMGRRARLRRPALMLSRGLRAFARVRRAEAAGAFVLGVVQRIGEAAVFAGVLGTLGADIGLGPAMAVHAAAIGIGHAAMLPGGVGAAEATLITAQTAYGVDAATAFAAGLCFRLAVFWFPMALGLVVLPPALAAARKERARGARKSHLSEWSNVCSRD